MHCVVFVNHVETNLHTRIVLQHISLKSGVWSDLLKKTVVTTTFYFPVEDDSVCIRKK